MREFFDRLLHAANGVFPRVDQRVCHELEKILSAAGGEIIRLESALSTERKRREEVEKQLRNYRAADCYEISCLRCAATLDKLISVEAERDEMELRCAAQAKHEPLKVEES